MKGLPSILPGYENYVSKFIADDWYLSKGAQLNDKLIKFSNREPQMTENDDFEVTGSVETKIVEDYYED